jgi:NAD(P)-dependent dehydrogenase (short-subunit alcohol dehydrogenase family)
VTGLPVGSWVVVTGAASGLGRSLAVAYARAGHPVALVDRDTAGLERVAAELGGGDRVRVRPVDLLDAAGTSAVLERLLAEIGCTGLVVACAGVDGPATSVGEPGNAAATARVIGVNTTGTIACVDAAVARLRQQGHGRVAVIASVAALRGLPGNGYAAYCASKAGIRAYVQSLQAELVRDGLADRISATLVLPGHFRSPMTNPADAFVIPLERITADVVRAVAARRREHVATGVVWRVQAALLRHAPLWAVARLRTG